VLSRDLRGDLERTTGALYAMEDSVEESSIALCVSVPLGVLLCCYCYCYYARVTQYTHILMFVI
jgi:hypothetical protein